MTTVWPTTVFTLTGPDDYAGPDVTDAVAYVEEQLLRRLEAENAGLEAEIYQLLRDGVPPDRITVMYPPFGGWPWVEIYRPETAL